MNSDVQNPERHSESGFAPKWLLLGGLFGLLVGSEAIYLALLGLEAVNGVEPVLTFWVEMSALFVLQGAAFLLVNRFMAGDRAAFWLIILGAVLFRFTLLPAGLPPDLTAAEKIEALQSDITGGEVSYERFQLFDNDIWRYIWDGHVWAHGVNPYNYAPSDTRLDTLAGVEADSLTETPAEDTADEDTFEDTAPEAAETSVENESFGGVDLPASPESIPDIAPNKEDKEDKEEMGSEAISAKRHPTDEAPGSGNRNDTAPAIATAQGTADGSLTDGLEIWGDIRENINYANVPTIYPPMAQFVFRFSHLLAPGSLLMMKFLLVLCEIIGVIFLVLALKRLEMPATGIILYAWNPLMIKVFAGSGHADSILLAALCATAYFIIRGSRTFAAVAFSFSILAKLSPVLLFPFVARRIGWKNTVLSAAVIIAGYLPFIGAGENLFAAFAKFAREWQFNAGTFALFRWFFDGFSDNPANLARQVCAILILSLVGFLTWRDDMTTRSFLRNSAFVMGAVIILGPTVMPWYLSWVLPLALLARQKVWFYFSFLVLAAFHIMIDANEYAVALWVEHGTFFALLCREVWLNRQTIKEALESGLTPAFAGGKLNTER